METFDSLLLRHRRSLISYMEEWSKQQENIISRYAAVMADGKHEEVLYDMQKRPTLSTDDPSVLWERPVANERNGPADLFVASGRACADIGLVSQLPSQSSEDPLDLRFASVETDGIRATLPCSPLEEKESGLLRQGGGGPVRRALESSQFGFAISFVILSNVVFMAIAADHMLDAASSGQNPTNVYILAGEVLFTGIYVIELVLKLVCYGRDFFCGFEWHWQMFDMVVVLSALADLLAPFFVGDAINVSYLRVNRLVKLVKMLRVVTVYRTFKELRLIITSILGCVRTMFWAIALLGTVLITFSLLFVHAVIDYMKANSGNEGNADMMEYWGSTGTAMISLFQSSTGGEDWAKLANPLLELGWVYYAAFMLYVCFFMFIVVNILTALFVDAALDHSSKDDIALIREEMQNKHDYVQHIKALYRRLDHDGSGDITWAEFSEGLQHPDMLAFASALDIEIADIHEFFRIISSDGLDVVDIENFVVGCIKLKGSAKALDVVSLIHKTKRLEHLTAAFAFKTDGHLQDVKQLLSHVLYEQERSKQTVLGPSSTDRVAHGNACDHVAQGTTCGTVAIAQPLWTPNVAWTPSPVRDSLMAPDFDVP